MIGKKQLFFSTIVSLLLFACSSENNHSSVNSVSSNTVTPPNKNSFKTPEKNAFENNQERLRKLGLSLAPEIQLGITRDGYSGKVLNGHNIDFRKVTIPDSYKNRTETITGKILGDIKNSRVCLDLNDDNLCNNDEPLAITKEDSTFELKVTADEKVKDKNLIAVRGLNTLSNRNETSILKANNKNNAVLSPFSTLIAVSPNAKTKLEAIYGADLESEDLYKDAIILQKTVDILASSYNKKEDVEIIAKNLEVYEKLADKLKTNLDDTVENLTGEEIAKAKNAVKSMITQVGAITLANQKEKEALAVVLNSRLNDAKDQAGGANDLTLDPINEVSLVKDAINIRLKEIFLTDANMSDDVLDAANKLESIKDLEDIEKVKAANELALKPLVEQLNKRNNATSNLLVLKALLVDDKLEIYFATNSEMGLSSESIEDLKDINKVKNIYKIDGLDYEIESSSWDDKGSKNTIVFKSKPGAKIGLKRISINYLALKDTKGKYTKEKRVYSAIELPRKIPVTGQAKVWFEKDDGSLRYGEKLNFEVDESSDRVVNNTYTNLMWQDAPYTSLGDNPNQHINYAQAKDYCENLSYAGHNDWRMPNVKELVSTTSINFQAEGIFKYYSKSEVSFSDSSQSVALGDRVIGVDKYGRVTNLIGNSVDTGFGKYSVRCVRNIDTTRPSLFPDAAFDNIVVLEKDKTSYDPSTNLVYLDKPFTEEEVNARKEASKKGFDEVENVGRFGDLAHAIEYCEKLNEEDNGKGFAGFKNWRVANANEVFYSLNSKGSRTFQHRLEGFDYTLTSSSSLKDNARYPWIVGNFFNRKPVHNRSKGFFRCVTNKNDKGLDPSLSVDTYEKVNIKRKYRLGSNKEINITLPANIFNRYEGISLSAIEPLTYLEDRQYEISNIIPKSESFPSFTLKSVIDKNGTGENICTLNTKWLGISERPGTKCEEPGLFRIYLQKDLALNTYGKSALQEGHTYAITIEKRYDLGDFTINLTIGENTQIGTGSTIDTTPSVDVKGFTVEVNQPQQKDIKIAVSSGYRMQDGSADILSSIDSNDLFKVITLKKDGEVFTCDEKTNDAKDKCNKKRYETIDALTNFKIVSGDKNRFEIWDGFHNYLHLKPENKLTLKVGDEYPLGIDVLNSDGVKIGETIDINVIVEQTKLETKNVSIDVKDSNNYKLETSLEPTLFTFDFSSKVIKTDKDGSTFTYNEHKINPFTNTNAVLQDIIFELEQSDDTYKIERVDFYGSKYYTVVLKDGQKPPVNKTLKVVAKIPYKQKDETSIKWNESKFDLTVTNNDDLTYQQLQLKAKNKTQKVDPRSMPRDTIVIEKINVRLQDKTYDASSGKTYPSSKALYLGKDFILSDKGLTDVEFEVVGGVGKEHFLKKLYFNGMGYDLQFDPTNLPTADNYTLKIKAKKDDLESNEANISFTIYPIKAPDVIDSINVNLVNKTDEQISLTQTGDKNITPLFLFRQKQNQKGTIELIKRFKLNANSNALNSAYNGVLVADGNIIHTLISSTDNKYYIKRVYRGYLDPLEPVYALFLKAQKTAQIGDVLKVKVTGQFNGVKYENPKEVTINIKGNSYTNLSTEDYENFVDPLGGVKNPYDENADANFVLKPEYTKTSDDPYSASSFKSIWIATDSLLLKPSKSPTGKSYILFGMDFDFEVVGGDKDKFKLEAPMYKGESQAYASLIIKSKDGVTLTAGDYSLQVRFKFKNSDKWSNTSTIKFSLSN